jgi:hypothetical protein
LWRPSGCWITGRARRRPWRPSAGLLDYSDEKGSYLLNRFKEQGIVDTVKSGFNDRIVVANHLAIEDLPRDTEESRLEQELKKFKKGKGHHER